MCLALAMGLLGGLFPAVQAVRLPVTELSAKAQAQVRDAMVHCGLIN